MVTTGREVAKGQGAMMFVLVVVRRVWGYQGAVSFLISLLRRVKVFFLVRPPMAVCISILLLSQGEIVLYWRKKT